MSFTTALGDDLCHKLRLVGLPKELVLPIVDSIRVSVNAEGPENVVKRLKVLKQAAVNHMAGVEIHLPWIRHNRHGPKGPWKPVWSMLISGDHRKRKRAFNAMMVYASLVLPKRAGPTPTQERKFLGSVTHTNEHRSKVASGMQILRKETAYKTALSIIAQRLGSIPYQEGAPHYAEWIVTKRGFGTRDRPGGRATSKALERDHIQLDKFWSTLWAREFHPFPEVQAVLGESMIDDVRSWAHPWHGFDGDWRESVVTEDSVIGVIGSSQEPGLKFRAFASPHMVLQCAMVPLKDHLLKLLKLCPWDCTHDQDAGVLKVQEWLKTGETVYSVDLSDATNNFPLAIQQDVLNMLRNIPKSSIQLLTLVSRSPFKIMWTGEKIAWDVGQPLGAGPSFPAFALGHAAICIAAEAMTDYTRLHAHGSSFLILGDDIVIKDGRVHAKYRELLALLQCPISESKCLQSSICAEFAGKLVTSSHIFHGFKYKELSDVSFMAVIKTIGSQAISKGLLTEAQYKYASAVRDFPEPAGLGFNPKGISYAVRYAKYLSYKDIREQTARPPDLTSKGHLRTFFAYSEVIQKGNKGSFFFSAPRPAEVTRREVADSIGEQAGPSSPVRVERNPSAPGLFKKQFFELAKQAKIKIDAGDIVPMLRGQKLVPSMILDGDPRPKPLLGMSVATLSRIERVNKSFEDWKAPEREPDGTLDHLFEVEADDDDDTEYLRPTD